MKRFGLCLSILLLSPIVKAAPEVPDNATDEDGDGWLATSSGFNLRATHPRVVVSREQLDQVVARMTGPSSRDPYARWFNLLKQAEDGGDDVSLTALALLWAGTQDATYLDRFIARVPTSGAPGLDELYGVDILFDALPDSLLTSIMQRAGAGADVFYYNSLVESQTTNYTGVSWGYHRAFGAAPALAYAGVFALTGLELGKEPASAPFDALNYVRLASNQISADGAFWRIERRIAGDPTYNDALPGSFGGMYDNFGYDTSEESYSINLVVAYATLTGDDIAPDFLHDRYRASFFQNMQYPYLVSRWDQDAWCHRGGTEAHQVAKIWNTQTDWISQPRTTAVAMTAAIHLDPRMQHYANQGVQFELCGAPYDGLDMNLLFYDDTLAEDPPSTNPTASYFNGPGLVVSRSDWSDAAAYAVLIAGEGISRRYEDANSFLLGRKGHVVTHAGARIRFNDDNDRHHWYAIRSASKNTMKIFDPEESFDVEADGTTGALHSGPPLVASDNLGGMIFETNPSNEDGCYPTGSGPCAQNVSRSGDAFPLGIYESANVVRFEHYDGDYTYATGDGAAAYTRKIDLYEREILHLRPDDVFVLFDRVRSADPSFRKVWVIHTVDEPEVGGVAAATGLGMSAYDDARTLDLRNTRNETTLDMIYPRENRVTVRGGDTVLARAPLGAGTPIDGVGVTALDIPRWVELLASGSDADGELLIEGDALEGNGVSESVAFSASRRQEYVSGAPDEVTDTSVVDAEKAWAPDQWANHMVAISCGGSSQVARITGNSATMLEGSFQACSAWQYVIFKYLANSQNHYTRVTSVSTTNLAFDELVLSIPHYFDTEDASGRLRSFAPKTDGLDDGYKKRTDLGQWTLNVEATEPAALDNFLNVFSLRDPGQAKADTFAVEGSAARGVLVGDRLITFAKDQGTMDAVSVDVPTSGALRAMFVNLVPNADYGCARAGATVTCTRGGGGVSGTASSMGVLRVDLEEGEPFDGGTDGAVSGDGAAPGDGSALDGGGSGAGPGASGGDSDSGCGCRTTPGGGHAWWLVTAMIGWLFRRRATKKRFRFFEES